MPNYELFHTILNLINQERLYLKEFYGRLNMLFDGIYEENNVAIFKGISNLNRTVILFFFK